MRLSRLGWIAFLAACPSSKPPVSAAAPTPAREARAALPPAPEPPPIVRAVPVPAGAIRFARVDAHRAALFLADVFRVNVIAVGGTGKPITIGIQHGTAEAALREVATASGLSLRRVGRGFWLGPAESLGGGKVSALRGGRNVDLFFYRIEAAKVVRLLQDVDRIPVEGSLTGTVSMALRLAPSQEVLDALVRLAGQEARVRGRAVMLSGEGRLPATPEGGGEPCPADPQQAWRSAALPCVPPDELEVCGTAVVGDRRVALVHRRGAGPGSGSATEVRSGSWLGEPQVRVASVDTDGIALDDGRRLPLGGSPVPACTAASLLAFSPGDGRSTREPLPPESFEWVDPAAAASQAVPCRLPESDTDCDTRARRVALASHPAHRIASSSVESTGVGVVATLEVDGAVEKLEARTHEAVAERMRELQAQGHKVMLRSAGLHRNPATRQALVQLLSERARVERRSRPLVRIDWAPLTNPVDALAGAQREAGLSGLFLREVTPQPGGTVRLIVGCP